MSGKLRMPTPKTNNLKKSILLRSPPCSPPKKKTKSQRFTNENRASSHSKTKVTFSSSRIFSGLPLISTWRIRDRSGTFKRTIPTREDVVKLLDFQEDFFWGVGRGKVVKQCYSSPPKKGCFFQRYTVDSWFRKNLQTHQLSPGVISHLFIRFWKHPNGAWPLGCRNNHQL